MDIRRKCVALILALTLLFSMAVTVTAADDEDPAVTCIRKMMNYYNHYQD